MNPLPDDGLENLCKEGFGQAIYLYSTRFSTAPKATRCVGPRGANELNYKSIEPLNGNVEAERILDIVYNSLSGTDKRPIYLHCWNGWHASGFISALSLRQFCAWTGEEAVRYWIQNTDGNSSGHEGILKRIREFQPLTSRTISAELQSRVCPQTRVTR